VNPVEPIPPVVFIELQDFPNMPALGQQPLICISSLIAPSGSVVERSCQGSPLNIGSLPTAGTAFQDDAFPANL
jgi:hypothetical protein